MSSAPAAMISVSASEATNHGGEASTREEAAGGAGTREQAAGTCRWLFGGVAAFFLQGFPALGVIVGAIAAVVIVIIVVGVDAFGLLRFPAWVSSAVCLREMRRLFASSTLLALCSW